MCGGSEAGSYLKLIRLLYHSPLGLRVKEKHKKGKTRCARERRPRERKSAREGEIESERNSGSDRERGSEKRESDRGRLGGMRHRETEIEREIEGERECV